MTLDWQLIAVGVIMALALLRIVLGIVRSVRRRRRGGSDTCDSCGCGDCPLSDKCKKQ